MIEIEIEIEIIYRPYKLSVCVLIDLTIIHIINAENSSDLDIIDIPKVTWTTLKIDKNINI